MISNGWSRILGCPECLGPLSQIKSSHLDCENCHLTFPVLEGCPQLISPSKVKVFEKFSRDYTKRRIKQGWNPMSSEEIKSLPWISPKGYPPIYWEIRKQSFTALLKFLKNHLRPSPNRVVMDAGAGVGWLSLKLYEQGFRTLAMDVSRDLDFGLGRIELWKDFDPNYFKTITGDINRFPLQKNSVSCILFNASLHYSNDLEHTLNTASQFLTPGGYLIILDSPISRSPGLSEFPGDRRIGKRVLLNALHKSGLEESFQTIQRSHRWIGHQILRLLKGQKLFSFPMIICKKLGTLEK